MSDFMILAALLLLAGAAVFLKVRKIKKKGFGCSCGCDGCSAAGCPHKSLNREKTETSGERDGEKPS